MRDLTRRECIAKSACIFSVAGLTLRGSTAKSAEESKLVLRKQSLASAEKKALKTFENICKLNFVQPVDFFIKVYVFGLDLEKQYTGFYSLFLSSDQGLYLVSGDDVFIEWVHKFVRGLERHPEILAEDFNILPGTSLGKIDELLEKMGIELDIDRE